MADQTLPDELIVTLRKPVKIGDVEYAQLVLREPTASEWEQWDGLEGVKADVKAVATVSGVPEIAVKQIGSRDLLTAARFIAGFLA